MGVSGMQEKSAELRKVEDGVRLFKTRTFLLHYRHATGGQSKVPGCTLCSDKMGAYDPIPEIPEPEPVVVQDSGDDKEGDPAPTLDRWWVTDEENSEPSR